MKLRALAIALLLSTCAQAAEPLSPPRRLEFAPLADGSLLLRKGRRDYRLLRRA
jgi:hypothetical protein